MAGELMKTRGILKIGQRVEFYLSNKEGEEKYLSRIEDITEDEIVVAMPVTKQGVPVIPGRGARLYTFVAGNQCRYKFLTTFRSAGKLDNGIPVWRIVLPEKMEYHQNREFFRVRVTHRIKVRLVDEEGHISDPIETQTVDLSGNGVSFILNGPVKEGTMAGLELCDIPGIGNLESMSRLVRCTRMERLDGEVKYYVGAHLEQLPPADMNKIVKYLFAVQRKVLARGFSF